MVVGLCRPRLTDALFCPQIMSVLLFIEHSVEVAHGKSSCKFSKTGYLRIGRSRGSQRVGRGGGGAPAGVGQLELRPCHSSFLTSASGEIPTCPYEVSRCESKQEGARWLRQ